MKTQLIARDGFPLELIEGRPLTNAFRVLLHLSPVRTWKARNKPPVVALHVSGLSTLFQPGDNVYLLAADKGVDVVAVRPGALAVRDEQAKK